MKGKARIRRSACTNVDDMSAANESGLIVTGFFVCKSTLEWDAQPNHPVSIEKAAIEVDIDSRVRSKSNLVSKKLLSNH